MTDLELLNLVIADLRRTLPAPLALPAPGAPHSVAVSVTEIKDPALRFFAEQLKPRPITPTTPLPPIDI